MITVVQRRLQREGRGSSPASLSPGSRAETKMPLHRFFAGDTMVLEQNMTGSVLGELLGIPGRRRATFGTLCVRHPRRPLRRAPVRIDSAHSSLGSCSLSWSPWAHTGDEEPGRIRIAPPNSRR